MVVADLMAATEKRVADLWDSQTIMAAHTERRTSPATADHGLQRRAIRWARRRTRWPVSRGHGGMFVVAAALLPTAAGEHGAG